MNELSTLNRYFQLPNSPLKNEAAFTTWFGKQVKDRGGFFHKISDYSLGYKPFDVIMALEGVACCVEFKCVKANSCIPYSLLRGSSSKKIGMQVSGLTDYQTNGGKSVIIVYSAKKNKYIIIDFDKMDLSTKIIF